MGFTLAIGVGPVNVLTVRRAINRGGSAGISSGLGAAAADAAVSLVVACGVTAISAFVQTHAIALQFGGSIFLIGWGFRVALARMDAQEHKSKARSIFINFASTFVLTFLNPANLAIFGLTAAGLGLLSLDLEPLSIAVLVSGVFIGSMLWWSALTAMAVALRRRFVGEILPLVNRIAGVAVVACGFALLFIDPAQLPGGADVQPGKPLESASTQLARE